MCNCGNKRQSLQQPLTHKRKITDTPRPDNNRDMVFEYTGLTGLSVTGTITRVKYRFDYTGQRHLIDGRDAPGMMGINVLKRVPEA